MGRLGPAVTLLLFALVPLSAAVLVAGFLIEAQPRAVALASSRPLPTQSADVTHAPSPTHAPGPTPHPAARDAGAWAPGDGRIFGAGGRAPNGVALDSVTAFDGAAWVDLPALPEPRTGAALVAMDDGSLLLFGGADETGPTDTTFVLGVGADAWSNGASMPHAATSMTAVGMGTRAYLFGGAEPGRETDFLVYDAAAQAWTAAAPVPMPLSRPMPAVVDGLLYLVGGDDANGEPTTAAFRYDPTADTWTTLPPMPAPASGAPTAILDGRLWVLAPRFEDARSVDSLSVFEPSTGRWLVAHGPTGFSAAGVEAALPLQGGRILLLGAGGGGFSVSVLSTAPMELLEP